MHSQSVYQQPLTDTGVSARHLRNKICKKKIYTIAAIKQDILFATTRREGATTTACRL